MDSERVKFILRTVFRREVEGDDSELVLTCAAQPIWIRDISEEDDCGPNTFDVSHSGLDPVAVEELSGLVASVAMAIFDMECKE